MWARGYRPLRPRTLLLELAVLAAAEALLFASYRGHEAGFHWATHFLVAMTVWATVALAVLVLKGAPARGQLLGLLAWHLFAMFPDLLFSVAEVPHDDWMDVFLAHIASHYMPGGAYVWLFLALATSASYVLVLAGWLRARRTEADAGMAPGIGLGGRHLIRAQRSPSIEPLAHLHLGADRPADVVLLHGLGASCAVWRPVAERLAARGYTVLVPDLLGFGKSRGTGTTFGLDDHVAAVERLLHATAAEQPIVVGHSFGCAVAVALADMHPDRIRALVLVSPPAFRDGGEARTRLGERSWLARRVVQGAPAAHLVCNVMCLTRPLAGRLMPRLARQVPAEVAHEGVEHTWPAYRDALGALLEDNPVPDALESPRRPTLVVLGEDDRQAPSADVLAYPHERVRVEVWPGDHLLPVQLPDRMAQLLEAELRSASR